MKKISTIAYEKIYALMMKRIYNDELTESQKKKYSPNADGIWSIPEAGMDGKNFFEKLFGKHIIARDHFWRKARVRPSDARTISFNEEILAIVLEYIDVKIPFAKVAHNERIKADILYDEFIKQQSLEDEIRISEMLFTKASISDLSDENLENNTAFKTDEDLIRELINKYYESISEGKYLVALECLYHNDSLNKDANENYANLLKGFLWNVRIFEPDIIGVSIDTNNKADCMVVFTEFLNFNDAYTDLNFNNTSYKTNYNTIGRLSEIMALRTDDDIIKSDMAKYYDFSLYDVYKDKIEVSVQKKIIEGKNLKDNIMLKGGEWLTRFYRLKLIKIGSNWLIHSVLPVQFYK